MSTIVVAGVDGGGSGTRALIADERGVELGRATGPACAVRPGEAAASAEVIAAVVREALAAAALGDVRPRALCAGVAGTGRDAESDALKVALRTLDVADDLLVLPDAVVALDDAFGDGAGVLLVAGTGSVAFARGPAGTLARCGGWGPVIGDEGSGAWIGRKALSIVTAASDGREPDTALIGAVLTATEVERVDELVSWAAAAGPGTLASLAPVVMTVAEAGDLRANALAGMAVEELMLHVRTLGRQLFVDERAHIPVALAGGLLARGAPLRRRLEHRIRTAVPGAQLRAEAVVPERGAVRGALRMLGLGMSDGIMETAPGDPMPTVNPPPPRAAHEQAPTD